MTLPSFTIVIPTYERLSLVKGLLTELAGLEYRGRWDVIVVIDGSRDGTADALRSVSWPFALTLVEQRNQGLAAARNAGAHGAGGDLLLFLDDDMRPARDILDRHAQAYLSHAGASRPCAVAGWIGLHAQSSPGLVASGVGQWTETAVTRSEQADVFDLYGGHFSVARQAFENVGGFDPAYTAEGRYGREDTDLAARLQTQGAIAAAPEARAWQIHDVPAREMLERSRKQGEADLRFALAHPRHAQRLIDLSGAGRAMDRLLLAPLANLPGMDRIARRIGTAAAKADTPLRRRVFDWCRRICWWSGAKGRRARHSGGYPRSRRVLALCYHAIADHSNDPVLAPYSIPPEMFSAHMASLRQRGFRFVDADTALAVAQGKAVVPRKSVLITFDDGYADLPDPAERFLAPWNIPFLAFLVSARIGQSNLWDQPAGARRCALLDAGQARGLIACNATLGSHSRTHADLTRLSPDEAGREIAAPRAEFAKADLPVPDHFAYPFGEKDPVAKKLAKQAGYAAAWGLADRRVTPHSDLFDLPRVMMHSSDTPWRFSFKTRFPTAATILRHWPFVAR